MSDNDTQVKRKRSAYEPPVTLDCRSGHPLHPIKKKRTIDIDDQDHNFVLANRIVLEIMPHTREYVTQPLCDIIYKLVNEYSFQTSNDFSKYFASIDAFIEWMCNIRPLPVKLAALKPAFKRYLRLPPHNLQQLQTQRAFLDTRDTTPEHRKLVRLLSDTPERETAWYNATVLAGYLDETSIRSSAPKQVYTRFNDTHQELLRKTNVLTKGDILRALLKNDIGTAHDAIGFARPSDLLTSSQALVHKNYVTVMERQLFSKKETLTSYYMQNVFLHLLICNPNLQTELDIANHGFSNENINTTRVTSKDTISTLQK